MELFHNLQTNQSQNMSKIYTFILMLLLAFTTSGLIAQNGICLDFDDLKPGDRIGKATNLSAGALFYSKDSIDVRLQPFLYPNGTQGFENVLIYNGNNTTDANVAGVNLFPSNINLEFDLSRLFLKVQSVCVEYTYWGGDINLSVNGADTFILSSIEELLALNGKQLSRDPATKIEIIPSANDRTKGTICLIGAVKSVLIGGQEFTLDNFCVYFDDVLPVCSITDLKVHPSPCTPNGIFYMDLDFNYSEENSGAYKVIVNNQVFGPFPYRSDSIPPVGPIKTYGDELFQVTVYDAESEWCQANTSFRNSCFDLCKIDDLDIRIKICEDDELAKLSINFNSDTAHPANETFTLFLDGRALDAISLARLPFDLDLPKDWVNKEKIEFKLCLDPNIVTGDSCCLEGTIIIERCESMCTIENLQAKAVDCNPEDGSFYVALKFDSDNTGDRGYSVFTHRGDSLGAFRYNNLPAVVGPFRGITTDVLGFIVKDNANRNCQDTVFLESYACEPACVIDAVKAEITQCLPNGNYDIYLDVSFVHQYRDAPFAVFVDGIKVGEYRSGSVPLLLEDVPVYSRATTFDLEVCPLFSNSDTLPEDCCISVRLDKQTCPPACIFTDIKAKITDCLPNGNFDILLDLEHEDTFEGSPFAVFVEGELIGRYSTDKLPLQLENVPVYTDALDFTVKVCPISIDNASGLEEACCLEFVLQKEDCQIDNSNCVLFDDLPSESYGGDQNPPNTEIFNTADISFRLFELQNLDWTMSYDKFSVLARDNLPDFTQADGQVLYYDGIASILSFANYPDPVEELSVNFYNTGSHINISANGAPIQILSFLSPGFYPLGNGISVEIELLNNSSQEGTMTFYGNIQALLIGGDQLALDNLCVNRKEPCEIGELSLIPTECDANGAFYLELDFRYANTSNYFIVKENGKGISKHAYADLPVKLGPFRTPYEAGSVFQVYDEKDDSCGSRAEFGPYFCELPCQITGIEVSDIECNSSDGTYSLSLQIKGENIGDKLLVETKSGFSRRYEYTGRPIRVEGIPITDVGYDKLQVCAIGAVDGTSTTACCKSVEYRLPCKLDCDITALEVSDIQCNLNEGVYSLILEIKGENIGDVVLVKTKSGFTKRYEYTGRAIRVEGIPITDEGYDALEVCAASGTISGTNNTCCKQIEYRVPCSCEITGAEVYDFECDTEKGVYHLTLAVKGENLGQVISVSTKSGFVYRFAYNGRPERISNIPLTDAYADGMTICAGVQANDAYACCYEFRYEVPCTLECDIKDVKVYDIECFPDGTYSLNLDIKGNNVDGGYYLVTRNGFEYKFRVENGMARIDNLPIVPGTNKDGFKICKVENSNQDCCFEVIFEVPCQQFCGLEAIRVFDFSCNDDSTYNLSLKIEGADFLLGEYLKFITESGYETRFEWTGEVITLKNIPNLGIGKDYYQLCAPNYADCCVDGSYEVPCDLGNVCRIGELLTETLPCEPNGSFFVELDFKHANTSGGFEVLVDGQSQGKFRYKDLPVRVGPVYQGIVPQEYHKLEVRDLEKDCGQSTRIESCVFETCNFEVAKVTPLECKDGEFYAEIQVQVNNSESNGYLVFAEGELFGPYQYNSKQRVIVGPFAGDGTSTYDFLFVDLGDPTCYGYQQIGPIDCEIDEECKIGDLVAEVLNCNDDGTYRVFLDFEHKGADNEYFDLFTSSGSTIGYYKLSDLPLEIDISFPNDGPEQYLGVCINDNPDCCNKTELIIPPCPPPCEGISFRARPTECNEDGQFKIELNLDIDIAVIYPVIIEVNGRLYDTVQVADRNFSIGPFKAGEDYVVTIIDAWRPECISKVDLGLVDCSDDCDIEALSIDLVSCYPDGSYEILVDFKYEGEKDDEFILLNAAGEKIKSFKYGDLPLKVERVSVSGDTPFLGVCTADKRCCTRVFVQFPECIPCSITEAKAYVAECYPDSVYLLGIKADWDTFDLDQYLIVEGDIAYPILERRPDGSLIIGPFFFDELGNERTLEILDVRNPNCVIPVRIESIKECEDDEDVWPGDANLDNKANHIDLLSLGFAWGNQGPSRTNIADTWTPTAAIDWGSRFTSFGPDLKHADCNGDGVVDEKDIEVIITNYGQTHGTPKEVPALPNTDNAPPLFFDPSSIDSLPNSTYFNIPIVLGSEDMPLSDLYGVAFTVEFDPSIIDPNKVEIVYPTSWLGEPGVNMATLDYTFQKDGQIDIALTRTDKNEVSGYGVVAYFRGIRDDIVGRHNTELRVQHGFGVHANQQVVNLNGLNTMATFQVLPEADKRYGLIDLKAGMLVYPNPSTEMVHIENRFGVPIDALQILTTNGQVMTPRYEGITELNVSELPEGLYLIRVEIGGYVIHQKLFKAQAR
ncbi:MAG: hypothetical protein Sapg2KO_31320 [Saprospiraceae bacterium]